MGQVIVMESLGLSESLVFVFGSIVAFGLGLSLMFLFFEATPRF